MNWTRWTRAMINSGERLDFSGLSRPTVDKHSTGGGRQDHARWFPWSPSAGLRCHSCPVGDSGIRAGRWTSLSQSLGGGLH